MKGVIIIEGHVQGLSNARSLGELGVPVIIVDKNDCIGRYSKYCRRFFRCPDYSSNSFADFLLQLADEHDLIDWVLLPSNDHAVFEIAKNRMKLEKVFKIVTPGLDIIKKIYDKGTLLEIASAVSVPIPFTQFFSYGDEPIKPGLVFPVLTKGRYGLSFYKCIGKKAVLSRNEEELRKHLWEISKKFSLKDTFTQELIPFTGKNKTVSFTAFCINGEIKTHWAGVKLREHPLQFGTATYAESIINRDCYYHSIPLLKQLNYSGVCEVEYLLDTRDGKYKLIEINPRTWLWVGLARSCGVDYAKLLYDYSQGQNVDWPNSYESGMVWYNPFSDFIYSAFAIIKGKLSVRAYFNSIFRRKKVNALFEKGDLIPGFVYFFSLFSFIRKR